MIEHCKLILNKQKKNNFRSDKFEVPLMMIVWKKGDNRLFYDREAKCPFNTEYGL